MSMAGVVRRDGGFLFLLVLVLVLVHVLILILVLVHVPQRHWLAQWVAQTPHPPSAWWERPPAPTIRSTTACPSLEPARAACPTCVVRAEYEGTLGPSISHWVRPARDLSRPLPDLSQTSLANEFVPIQTQNGTLAVAQVGITRGAVDCRVRPGERTRETRLRCRTRWQPKTHSDRARSLACRHATVLTPATPISAVPGQRLRPSRAMSGTYESPRYRRWLALGSFLLARAHALDPF